VNNTVHRKENSSSSEGAGSRSRCSGAALVAFAAYSAVNSNCRRHDGVFDQIGGPAGNRPDWTVAPGEVLAGITTRCRRSRLW
jgi:hypothetical protein